MHKFISLRASQTLPSTASDWMIAPMDGQSHSETLMPGFASKISHDHTDVDVLNSSSEKTEAEAMRDKPSDSTTVTRRTFYASDKKAVCEMYVAHPGITHQRVADRFGISKSMVTRILKDRDEWFMSKHADGSRFARKGEDHTILSDKMIREQAILMAEKLGMRGEGCIYQFRCGRTWLRQFKERFGIVDGVATRLGYTETDLAREKAFGSFPLDMWIWLQLPDEHGNYPQRPPRCKSEFDDMDFEIIGDFVAYTPRAGSRPAERSFLQPTESTSHEPVVANSSPPYSSPDAPAMPFLFQAPILSFDTSTTYFAGYGDDLAVESVDRSPQNDSILAPLLGESYVHNVFQDPLMDGDFMGMGGIGS
ncbi:uncharacterized protein B0H18DRAFT_956282 [Fomitopsis serialis]|uniref:uncharacterized protein n=1 Tax=Fomitopsis serialis TaxID=139415 RepID=UPI0020073ECF|nr:uncharacterized protein B0H18DRAFT_956282 [Neoantrodia serialis]KAH9922396.1 hypothetical protein B0H18DRAFT_956282 [Neoantrodia serialis]